MASAPSSSAAAPSASGVACSTADFTVFPSQDVGCAVGSISGLPSNTTDAMKDCCKADPTKFADDCGLFCLSFEQSVADLQKCFMEKGIVSNTIFCNGNQTATATGKPDSVNSPTSSASGASGTSSGGAQQSTGAAAAMLPPQSVSKAGLGMLAMVLVSAVAGAAIL